MVDCFAAGAAALDFMVESCLVALAWAWRPPAIRVVMSAAMARVNFPVIAFSLKGAAATMLCRGDTCLSGNRHANVVGEDTAGYEGEMTWRARDQLFCRANLSRRDRLAVRHGGEEVPNAESSGSVCGVRSRGSGHSLPGCLRSCRGRAARALGQPLPASAMGWARRWAGRKSVPPATRLRASLQGGGARDRSRPARPEAWTAPIHSAARGYFRA